MQKSQSQLMWGVLLIAGGFVFLLQNLGFAVFEALSGLLWSVILGLGGLAFIMVFTRNRDHWWSLIPGLALLSVSGLAVLGWLAPRLADAVGGSLFLGGLSLAFWLIYLNDRHHWWAVIPGGVLLTLAAVAGFDNVFNVNAGGVIFFLGLAATFGVLTLLPGEDGQRMRWPLFPALGCLALAVLTSTMMTAVINFIWPISLIGVGLYLLLRSKSAVVSVEKISEKSPPKGEGIV